MPKTHPLRASPKISRGAGSGALLYVTDTEPGIRRVRHGSGFAYRRGGGERVLDRPALDRIRALAIPPAWTDVWICASPDGHLQATGRDARGRKQYRYHPRWQESRGEDKFARLAAFGAALPRLRRAVRRHLRLPGLPREKVLAAVARLLDLTGARIGNEEYRRANGSFGLTTLRNRHAVAKGGELKLSFRAKSGVLHDSSIKSPRLARVVRRCQDLPGQQLFQYLDEEGKRHSVSSTDVNDYLRDLVGADCSAKDFRTWRGSVEALTALAEIEEEPAPAALDRQAVSVVDRVAKELGNTRAVCRKHYIHPSLLESFLEGRFRAELAACRPRKRRDSTRAEQELLAFLRRTGRKKR
ncbi:MAG TPA: DNA topoisomerase IB [Thermoanaerobaculia bacterium]|nr:DNA topoisomerase IB [Thermoanaerobaculia bacterium]